jgi:heme-degrading monooxygenase HmoA
VYGTLGRMTPKAGTRDELIAMMSSPPTGSAANGYRGGYVLEADEGDDVVVAVMYDDKDAYFAMVHDPQTDENFGKIMELLEGEPTWTDGDWLGPGGERCLGDARLAWRTATSSRQRSTSTSADEAPRRGRTVAPGLGYAPRSWRVERSSSSIW